MNKKQKQQRTLLYFRKYSRKKFATFNSLGKLIKISTLGVACSIIASPVQGQNKEDNDSVSKKLELEEVEVVGQKTTVIVEKLPRLVELIDAQIIQNSPSQSFQDLIQYSSNIDISQRGQFGIQSDVSIRGGSFDQVLILQNGINLTDPQTGHHNLNLPIDQESIYKIEVLNGPAARALGANAFTGAINIITKPEDNNHISLSLNTGQFGYFRAHIGANLTTEKTKHLLSASYSVSNGYMANTDFSAVNFYYHGDYQLTRFTKVFTQFGVNNKAFGANSYYTPKFPEQFEETSIFYFTAGLKTGKTIIFKPEVFWRRHIDRFELFREDKDYYGFNNGLLISNNPQNTLFDTITWYTNHNYHQTDIFGANINASYKSIAGTTTFGTGMRSENILSNALGTDMVNQISVIGRDDVFYDKQDFRNSFDLFTEHSFQGEKLFLSGGALLHWNSFEPNKLNFVPGIDAGVNLTENISFVGSYNYTIGHPTFTDLGYRGPTNQGNPNLKPYSQHSYETGFKLKSNSFRAGIIGFYTNGKNNINWVRNDELNRYLAINIDLSENIGLESFVRYRNGNNDIAGKFLNEIYIGYTFIDTYRSISTEYSKYTNIRNKAVARIVQKPLKNIILSWNFMYKQRIGDYLTYNFESGEYIHNQYPEVFLIDLRATYTIKKFVVYIEGSNLLDKIYIESGSIPQPGIWFKGGIKYRFEF